MNGTFHILYNISWQSWLFNFCPSFQFRKGGLIKGQDQGDAGDANRDEYNWPLCTNGESHPIRKLLLAQVIPKNELLELAHKVHHLRNQLGLNQFCHQLEDFAEAYSLQKISESKVTVSIFFPFMIFFFIWFFIVFQYQSNTSPNAPGRSTSMYKCRMCPQTAFKWQSCLYKHFLMNHFNEKIRSQLVLDKEPFKCPKCEYTAKLRHVLLLHYGITHKVVAKMVSWKYFSSHVLYSWNWF